MEMLALSSPHRMRDVSERTGHLVKERDRPPSKKTLKVLLLFALVLFSVLGVLDFNKGVSAESFCVSSQSIKDLCDSAVEGMSAQLCNATATAEKLKSRLDQVQADYENAQRQIASFSETGGQCKALKDKYSKVHEVFSTCTESHKCGQCGENWKRFGVKCYFFSPDFLNWTNSRDRCVKMGGHLIIITSQAEQTFVSTGLGRPHWIGLNDLETEGKWMWVNNQSLTETGVTFWSTIADGADEPNNWKEENPAGENCASLGDEKGRFRVWFDASCSKTRKYICEK